MSTDHCVQALATAHDAMAGEHPALPDGELQRIKTALDAMIREAEIANAVHGLGAVKPARMR